MPRKNSVVTTFVAWKASGKTFKKKDANALKPYSLVYQTKIVV